MTGEEDRIRQIGKRMDAELARVARRLQARRRRAQPTPAVSPPVPGSWSGLAESLSVFAAESAGVPGAGAAAQVIRALCGIENAQAAMLKSIQRDVQLLREGPFKAAQEQLRTAMRKGPSNSGYAHHLREAEDLLISALTQSASIEESSVIRFYLGVVAIVNGNVREARYRFVESYRDCVNVTEELASKAADVKVLKNRWTAAAMAYLIYPGVVIGTRKWLKALKSQEASLALESYIPFVNIVARSATRWRETQRNQGCDCGVTLTKVTNWNGFSLSVRPFSRWAELRSIGSMTGTQRSGT